MSRQRRAALEKPVSIRRRALSLTADEVNQFPPIGDIEDVLTVLWDTLRDTGRAGTAAYDANLLWNELSDRILNYDTVISDEQRYAACTWTCRALLAQHANDHLDDTTLNQLRGPWLEVVG